MLSVIIPIFVLALIDSINPVELLAGILLFTIKKPLNRFLYYVSGIFVFHFLLGFIFYYVFNFIFDLKILSSPILDRPIELVGGMLLIIFGLTLKKKNKSEARKIIDPKPLYVFLLGIGITITAIPTSVSYFSALGIMAENDLDFRNICFLLLMYNLIFILPLILLLAVYLLSGKHSEKIFQKVRTFIISRLNRLLKIVLILAGSYLVINFFMYLFSR